MSRPTRICHCVAQSDLLVLAALCAVTFGLMAALAPMLSLPSSFLSGTAAAGGIALCNTVGSFGGFAGPYMLVVLKQEAGGYASAMAVRPRRNYDSIVEPVAKHRGANTCRSFPPPRFPSVFRKTSIRHCCRSAGSRSYWVFDKMTVLRAWSPALLVIKCTTAAQRGV